jgi:DNA (cytosine-5)-methyltransferase 1
MIALRNSGTSGQGALGFVALLIRRSGLYALGVPAGVAQDVDLGFLQRKRATNGVTGNAGAMGIVDLFSGIGGLSVGAIEGARRKGRRAHVQLAVDSWAPALEVLRKSLRIDKMMTAELDLADVVGGVAVAERDTEQPLLAGGQGVALLLAGPPCQGHSALNNRTRHDDPRNDLYMAVARVARLLEPTAVVVENVSGVGRDKRRAAERCTAALAEQGYWVQSRRLNLSELGAPQRRIRHVLVATQEDPFDFDLLAASPGRDVAWAVGDLLRIDSEAMMDTPSVPSEENDSRIDWLFENGEYDLPNDLRPVCHHNDHSYRSMYGRLRWDEPAQTITSGFGSMGQGRFVHPLVRRTLTPHEAARLQFLPDFMDFSGVTRRSDLATMIGNAAPPILTISVVEAQIDQGLV